MLRMVRDMAPADGHDVTVLSGEIHLATRATMKLGAGHWLHQLVASGIAPRQRRGHGFWGPCTTR